MTEGHLRKRGGESRERRCCWVVLICGCLTAGRAAAADGSAEARPQVGTAPVLSRSEFAGWKSWQLTNGLIELQIVPEIGGRVVQFRLGDKAFFWINPQLAGTVPPPGGLGPDGSWLNYGGDKLWPAPQGWDNDRQWPGPPDAVLDGSPYAVETDLPNASLRLTSGDDPRSGIRFSRVIRVFPGSTRVSIDATMQNIDAKPRRWGIWAHTQLDGGRTDGTGHNPEMNAWCPVNRKSHFPKGYRVIFGAEDNPSFQPDRERGLMRVQYQYQVGKIGLDSRAGWVATVDGSSGAVFVQRFTFAADREYPDGSSVEFWLNGVGKIHAYHKDIELKNDPRENPFVFESEVLSPFARLQPGQSYTWHYDWYAAQIGGNYPVVDCTDAGVTAEPLVARVGPGKLHLHGRFGVFSPGTVRAVLRHVSETRMKTFDLVHNVSPGQPLIVRASVDAPADVDLVSLELVDAENNCLGELARTRVPIVKCWLAPPADETNSAPQ